MNHQDLENIGNFLGCSERLNVPINISKIRNNSKFKVKLQDFKSECDSLISEQIKIQDFLPKLYSNKETCKINFRNSIKNCKKNNNDFKSVKNSNIKLQFCSLTRDKILIDNWITPKNSLNFSNNNYNEFLNKIIFENTLSNVNFKIKEKTSMKFNNQQNNEPSSSKQFDLQKGFRFLEDQKTKIFFYHVKLNNFSRILFLLKNEPTLIDKKDEILRTALHISVSREFHKLTKLFLSLGLNPNLNDLLNRTPLSIAYEKNNSRFIKVILQVIIVS